ncbi:3'-5' exonuclease [Prochlorococcus sp. MIT 0801]|uniref:3'-5' exonuclease n=1 Tax=Prochlorococcus sp. MIT 0801 TaxID=1501269 RepID=UPI0004F8E6CA|nr:3'-5' exonuclease [Prochlorococcus sp. MIT 0801]AIQ96814.1 putative DNA polymerasee III [Prochlorococcus sp. MIT 0801]
MQNRQKESEQLGFLYETTREISNKKEIDLGVKSSLNSKKEPVEILREERLPKNILILDTETTGLDNKNDDCLEVGSILFNVKTRSVLAQQSFLLPVENNNAEKINNIPAEITRLPQPLSEAIKYFESLVRVSDVIVAHNAEFDMKWFGLNKLPEIDKKWICSMDDITWPADRQLKPRPSVRDLALAYGVPVWNAHRALTDCIYLAEVFKRCSELEKLLIRALEPKILFRAEISYEERDLAKRAGFRWNDAIKGAWSKRMSRLEMEKLDFPVQEVDFNT